MKKRLFFGLCIAASMTLSACGSFGTQQVGDETYLRVFDQPTDKLPRNLAECLNEKLKGYQESAYIRPKTTEIWVGAVPSGDSNQPQATIEINLPPSQIHAAIKVFQRQPVVEEINVLIKECL